MVIPSGSCEQPNSSKNHIWRQNCPQKIRESGWLKFDYGFQLNDLQTRAVSTKSKIFMPHQPFFEICPNFVPKWNPEHPKMAQVQFWRWIRMRRRRKITVVSSKSKERDKMAKRRHYSNDILQGRGYSQNSPLLSKTRRKTRWWRDVLEHPLPHHNGQSFVQIWRSRWNGTDKIPY